MRAPFRSLFLAGLLCTAALAPGRAQAQVVVTINGDEARADINLPGPGGPYLAEVRLRFRNPVNLTAACLGISAVVLDAGGIAALNARLPDAALAVDPAFPMVVTIEPPSACGLAFSGNYEIEFRAINLVWAPGSPYRLYKAPIGTSFHDITASVVAGSVRARGASGSFSEFVVVVDNAPDYASELQGAYLALEEQLDNPEIGVTAMTTLLNDLEGSKVAAAAADYAGAIAAIDRLLGHAQAFSNDGVPGQWRSQRDLVNVEGDLVGLAGVARFTLGRLAGDP